MSEILGQKTCQRKSCILMQQAGSANSIWAFPAEPFFQLAKILYAKAVFSLIVRNYCKLISKSEKLYCMSVSAKRRRFISMHPNLLMKYDRGI